jgi:hypothetical protein
MYVYVHSTAPHTIQVIAIWIQNHGKNPNLPPAIYFLLPLPLLLVINLEQEKRRRREFGVPEPLFACQNL